MITHEARFAASQKHIEKVIKVECDQMVEQMARDSFGKTPAGRLEDSLYGMKVVMVADRTKRVPVFRLPRTRAKTSSVRKAYNRLRRQSPVVYKTEVVRLEDTAGSEVLMVGSTAYVSPRGYEALRKATEQEAKPKAVSTADVTCESVARLARECKGSNLLRPDFKLDLSPSPAQFSVSDEPRCNFRVCEPALFTPPRRYRAFMAGAV